MIDLARVVWFEWDVGNARKNERHGVTQIEIEDIFFDRVFCSCRTRATRNESRASTPSARRRSDGGFT